MNFWAKTENTLLNMTNNNNNKNILKYKKKTSEKISTFTLIPINKSIKKKDN